MSTKTSTANRASKKPAKAADRTKNSSAKVKSGKPTSAKTSPKRTAGSAKTKSSVPAKAAAKKASKSTAKPRARRTREKTEAKPSVSVVIVTRDATTQLRECLQTLACDGYAKTLSEKHSTREVFVVEAGSGEHTTPMMAAEFPAVVLIHRPDNAGTARSTNLATDAAVGRYILLLDPETRVSKGTVAKLVEYMENHLHVGAVSPEVVDENGQCCAGPETFPSLREEFAREWRPLAQRVGIEPNQVAVPKQASSVDWVARHCMLVRRNALKQVGPFDDGYSMYFAEADWCRRARRVGWGIHYHPGLSVRNQRSSSFVRESLRGWPKYQFEASRRHYFRKHHGASVAVLVDALHGLRTAATATKAALERARTRGGDLGNKWKRQIEKSRRNLSGQV